VEAVEVVVEVVGVVVVVVAVVGVVVVVVVAETRLVQRGNYWELMQGAETGVYVQPNLFG
jgi:hypothetical protein